VRVLVSLCLVTLQRNLKVDFRKVFSGTPDGNGLGEDPAYLVPLYQEFEQVCFDRTTPKDVRPLRMWFPVDQYFDKYGTSNLNTSRWLLSRKLFEAYRFAEAGTAAVQVVSEDRWEYVKKLHSGLPEHLQTELFSLPVETLPPSLLQHFRMAFRLSWLQANCDESIMLMLNQEAREVEKVTRSNAPETLYRFGESIDLRFEASTLASEVRSYFRSEYTLDNRLKCLSTVQEIIEYR